MNYMIKNNQFFFYEIYENYIMNYYKEMSCCPKYITYYWNPITINLNNFFIGSTDLYGVCGNKVGTLLLTTNCNNAPNNFALKESFTFIFNNGSMDFTVGFNQETYSKISNGVFGVVSNKSGIYPGYGNIDYYFQYDYCKNMWKITFRYC